MALLELVVLLMIGGLALVAAMSVIDAVAGFAGNVWRKFDHKENEMHRTAQEYLRSHPDAVRAPWRQRWPD